MLSIANIDVSPEDIRLLFQRYADPVLHDVNYLAFIRDLECETPPAPATPAAGAAPPSPKAQSLPFQSSSSVGVSAHRYDGLILVCRLNYHP